MRTKLEYDQKTFFPPFGDFTAVQSVPHSVADPVRVLLLLDTDADVELIKGELSRSDLAAVYERVETEGAFAAALREFAPDVILSNHSPDGFSVRAILALVRQIRPTTALIVIAESVSGAEAVACVRAGAEDLVLKQNIKRLPAAINSAVSVRRPLEKLTPRQIEVLKLVALGRRTREIATELKLSVKTVESHRGEVMKRLGVRDVVSLVHYAMRVGLIPSAA